METTDMSVDRWMDTDERWRAVEYYSAMREKEAMIHLEDTTDVSNVRKFGPR